MNRQLLYVNNELVDLYPDTVIAQTIQAFELGELGSVRVNYTNQIKVPKTGNNRQIFQFSEDPKSSTAFPYTSYSARYVQNGLEIIRNGSVVLKETDNSYQLNIFSGPVGFFDFIETKKLWDLDFLDLNTGWDSPDRDAIRNATTGMVQPLFNDGIIVYNGVIPAIEHNQSPLTKMPWVYYHTVIDKIFSTAGYEKSGDIFNDPAYLKLAMPMTVAYSAPFRKSKGFSAAAPGTQTIVNPASYTEITFDQVSYNGSDGFYDGTNSYIVDNPDTTNEYFNLRLRTTIDITVAGGTVDIVLQKINFPTTTNLGISHTNVGTGVYSIGTGVGNFLADGDTIAVKVIKNTGTPTVTVNSGIFDGECQADISLDYAYFNHLFQDIDQIDFLKDFSVRFNVKMIERNGVIVCKTMNEILADQSSAIDWSDKQVPGNEKIKYAFGGLARSNYFNYGTDTYTDELSDEFAQGVFTIANENISESQVIYDSLFTMSDSETFDDDKIFMATVPGGDEVTDLGIRLFYIRQNTADDPTVYYNVTGRTDYKVAYFIDPNYEYSMHWQYFLDNYYADFVAKLQKAKALTRRYNLTDVDIHTFDQFKLIYDSGGLYIATRINNYISGQAPDVELFKVG